MSHAFVLFSLRRGPLLLSLSSVSIHHRFSVSSPWPPQSLSPTTTSSCSSSGLSPPDPVHLVCLRLTAGSLRVCDFVIRELPRWPAIFFFAVWSPFRPRYITGRTFYLFGHIFFRSVRSPHVSRPFRSSSLYSSTSPVAHGKNGRYNFVHAFQARSPPVDHVRRKRVTVGGGGALDCAKQLTTLATRRCRRPRPFARGTTRLTLARRPDGLSFIDVYISLVAGVGRGEGNPNDTRQVDERSETAARRCVRFARTCMHGRVSRRFLFYFSVCPDLRARVSL